MKSTLSLLTAILFFLSSSIYASVVTTLNNSDPVPNFSSNFPYSYLASEEKDYTKGKVYAEDPHYFSLSISPFYQRADKGKNSCGTSTQLGDLTGRWNMLSMFPFDSEAAGGPDNDSKTSDKPTSQTFPTYVQNAGNDLIGCTYDVEPGATELQSIEGLLSLQTDNELFGFFSVPIEYRKRGVRFSASARFKDLGISVQTGIADISQCPSFIDYTTTPTGCVPSACVTSTPTGTQPVINYLNPFGNAIVSDTEWSAVVNCVHKKAMLLLVPVAKAYGLDLNKYTKTAVEDVHMELFWRRAIPMNTKKCRGGKWPSFIFMPFASAGGTVAFAPEKNQDNPFSLPSGNNGHDAIRFNGGFTLDFFNSFELGASAGFTNFREKNFLKYRIPNNKYQNVIYPFKTNVCYNPGNTWHTGAFINSYNYCDGFSFYAEYLWASHSSDKITLLDSRDAADLINIDSTTGDNKGFKPDTLEAKTPWSIQVINTGLTWMASPNFILGASAQIPIQRKNAYKSTTIKASLEITY